MPFALGELIDGHYRVEQRFAGGMGFVYVVRDEVVGKRFAIKQLSELHAENQILRERFRREASTWLLLDYHAHIVQAHSYLPRADAPMLILECVDGPSMERLLRAEKRLCNEQVIAYARQFCLAMQHAHTRVIPERGVGVLHRDIKPGNLLLTRTNQIKVTDFGLAKIQGDPNLTSIGQFVGTVAYSPPEQLRGAGDVTKASDVYSYGAVMYQMLTGRQPFRGSNTAELYHAVQDTEPQPIRQRYPEVHPELEAIVWRCLRKNPDDRFADFHALEQAIDEMKESVERVVSPCKTCGFMSQRSPTKCSVCGSAATHESKTTVPKTRRQRASCATGVERSERGAGKTDSASAGIRTDDDSDAPLPVLEISDSTPECHAEQKSAWNLDAGKEYLVELRPDGTLSPWLLERAGYTLGRGENMKIRIDDSSLARFQLFLVRLPCGWLAMNPPSNSPLEVNGWNMRQRVLRPGDLLRVGATWLAFAAPIGTSESLTPIPGRWLDRTMPKGQTTKAGTSHTTVMNALGPSVCTLELAGNRRYTSRGQPLRIGSSPLCELKLDDPTVAPVHALVAWQLDGPHLVPIVPGRVREMAGAEVTDRLLRDGDLLQIGDVPMRARVAGDLTFPGRAWAKATSAPNRFAMTVLTGPQRGQTVTLPNDEAIIFGRHSDCDAIVGSDSFISRRHLQATAGDSEIDFKDLDSRSGFFLNQAQCTNTAIGRLGDVVVVGRTSILIHYEVESE